jgi:hypothetical protein
MLPLARDLDARFYAASVAKGAIVASLATQESLDPMLAGVAAGRLLRHELDRAHGSRRPRLRSRRPNGLLFRRR